MTSTFWVKAALNNSGQSPFLKSVKYNWRQRLRPTNYCTELAKTNSSRHLFYNNWVISCVLIGQELWLIRTSTDFGNGMMVAQFVFTFLSHVTFWWEMSTGMNFKNYQHYAKKKSTTKLFIVCTLINHRNDVKMFETLQWDHLPMALCSTWVLIILMSCLWSIRVQLGGHGNLFSICKTFWKLTFHALK